MPDHTHDNSKHNVDHTPDHHSGGGGVVVQVVAIMLGGMDVRLSHFKKSVKDAYDL